MATMPAKPFSAVEYIQELRKAEFTEAQAEAVVTIFEQQAQVIQEQTSKINNLESKELATKGDIRESELRLHKEIALASNKTILWIVGVLGAYGLFFLGVLAKGFHWF